MQTPREILETYLRNPTDIMQSRCAAREALAALKPLEADAARWSGFRRAAVAQDERRFDAFEELCPDAGAWSAEEMDTAADRGREATE